MAEKKNDNKQKNYFKYLLIALFVIAIALSISNLFEWPSMSSKETYGQTLESKITVLKQSIKDLENRVDNLSSRNLALFILVFISLGINIIILITHVISRMKQNASSKK